MLLVFTLYALFASVFTVEKGAVAYASPFFIVGARMLLAGVLMLGYSFLHDRNSLKISRRTIGKIFLLGFFNIYLTNVLELWGLQYLSSFKTCFLYSLSPFLSALISYFLLDESLHARKWLGLLIGFVGFIPILAEKGSLEELSGIIFGCSIAQNGVLLGVISSVLGWIVLHQLVQGNACPTTVANGYAMLIGGALATIQSLVCEPWNPFPVTDYPIFFKSTAFLLIVSNLICYNLYGYLLRHFSPTFMSFAGLSTSLFTAFFGWIFFDEVISLSFFVSLAIVSAGLTIFYLEEIKLQALKSEPL
jgi:drug/metabolite transporter (DMT)-like permease